MHRAARTGPLPTAEAQRQDWRVLRALNLYRLLVGSLLAAIFLMGLAPDFIGAGHPGLFQAMGYAWFAAGSLLMILLVKQLPSFSVQLVLHVLADLLLISGLLLGSRGVGSGLGLLLLVPVLGYGLLLPPRLAALVAACATLCLFGVELWRQYPDAWAAPALTQAGMLGMALFAVAVSASTVAVRARRFEARAQLAGSALTDLSRINDTIVETMRSGVVVVDERGMVRTLNAAARKLLEPRGTVIGQPLENVAPALALDLHGWRHGALPMATLDLGARELLVRYSSLSGDSDGPVLLLLEDARHARDAAQRLKLAALGQLSASIAHEIRNPLSAITQATDLLEAAADADEAERLRGVVRRHAQRIDGIVRDVLDLGRGAPPRLQRQSLRGLLQLAQKDFLHDHAPAPRMRLTGDGLDTAVHFDAQHFCRILYNLWSNSVSQGAREIAITATGEGARVLLHVRDDGPGIAPEVGERVFEPFFTTRSGGTGLGLYLARTLAEANGAELLLGEPSDTQADEGLPGAHLLLRVPVAARRAT